MRIVTRMQQIGLAGLLTVPAQRPKAVTAGVWNQFQYSTCFAVAGIKSRQ